MVVEKIHVLSTGKIDTYENTRTGGCQEIWNGKCQEVNYRKVMESFLYYGHIFNDQESLNLVNRILK